MHLWDTELRGNMSKHNKKNKKKLFAISFSALHMSISMAILLLSKGQIFIRGILYLSQYHFLRNTYMNISTLNVKENYRKKSGCLISILHSTKRWNI